MPNLLVVDDDLLMLSSLTDVLASGGYQVASASSGQEALRIAEATVLDMVISDVRMEGMDGIQCIAELTAGRPQLKSIVITGYASDDAPGRAMDVACSDYLRKPFTAEQLLQSVSRALSAQQERQGYLSLMWGKAVGLVEKTRLALSGLEAARQKAFESFYLGIRSGHLGIVAALAVWDILDAVETRRLELEKTHSLPSEAAQHKEQYAQACDCCKVVLTRKRAENGISRLAFQPFFKNIRDGAVSAEQVKLGTYLRQLSQLEMAQSSELQQLYRQVWT